MIIGAIFRNNVEAKAFVNKTHKRLKNNPMLNGGAFYTEDESTRLKCYFGLKPVLPSLFFLAIYVFVLGLVLALAFEWGLLMYALISLFLFSTDYFRSEKFTLGVLKKGLKKEGYKGIIIPLTDSDIWEVLENGAN